MGYLLAISMSLLTSIAFAGEGFYFIDDLPSPFANKRDESILKRAALTAGAFSSEIENTLSRTKTKAWVRNKCKNSRIRLWNETACREAESCLAGSTAKCHFVSLAQCGAVAVKDNDIAYLVTAKHCYSADDKGTIGRFLSLDGKSVETFSLDFSQPQLFEHSLPYDIALFPIKNWKSDRPVAEVSAEIPKGLNVFAIGFPKMDHRTKMSAEYPIAYNDMRVSFGKVIEPNLKAKSFCHFSNDISKARPTKWTLEDKCPVTGAHSHDNGKGKYEARVEHDVLITDTDMLNGMSGSALYTEQGQLIGIGTTILKNGEPLNYRADIHAVYVKAVHLFDVLKQTEKN